MKKEKLSLSNKQEWGWRQWPYWIKLGLLGMIGGFIFTGYVIFKAKLPIFVGLYGFLLFGVIASFSATIILGTIGFIIDCLTKKIKSNK